VIVKKVKKVGYLAVVAVFLISVLAALPASVMAASVAPVLIPGAANPPGPSGNGVCYEFKLEDTSLANGEHADGTLTVTISNLDGHTFDWSSNIPVSVVYVKNGNDGTNMYDYRPLGSTGDTCLTTPNDGAKGISHISFFYCEPEIPIPEFSTIALPALSLVGLFAFFSYRKRK
jgi:hypothetical protein